MKNVLDVSIFTAVWAVYIRISVYNTQYMCISISTSAFSKKIISVVKTLRYKKYITDCFLRDHALQYSKNSNKLVKELGAIGKYFSSSSKTIKISNFFPTKISSLCRGFPIWPNFHSSYKAEFRKFTSKLFQFNSYWFLLAMRSEI